MHNVAQWCNLTWIKDCVTTLPGKQGFRESGLSLRTCVPEIQTCICSLFPLNLGKYQGFTTDHANPVHAACINYYYGCKKKNHILWL